MTVQDSYDMFNHTKESTTSSPSGIHYGHYKVACESEALSAINHIFMVAPLRSVFHSHGGQIVYIV